MSSSKFDEEINILDMKVVCFHINYIMKKVLKKLKVDKGIINESNGSCLIL